MTERRPIREFSDSQARRLSPWQLADMRAALARARNGPQFNPRPMLAALRARLTA